MIRTTLALTTTTLVGLSVLWGCSTTTTTTQSDPTFRERTTESDQTDADRRARVRLELASGYYARGQLETALDEVKLVLAVKPDLPDAYNLRGLIYQSLGDDRLAEENFKRALQLSPRDPDVMHNYGWFLCQNRRMPEAFAQFQQAIATPRYAGLSRSLMAQGVCQARTGAYADAERSLVRAYELDPTNPLPHLRLAEALSRIKDVETAVGEFAIAASTLLKLGRRDDALKVFERLLHHKPDPAHARLADDDDHPSAGSVSGDDWPQPRHVFGASDQRAVGVQGSDSARRRADRWRPLGHVRRVCCRRSTQDLLVELPRLLLWFNAKLGLQDSHAHLVLLERRPPASQLPVEAHHGAVHGFLQRIDRDQP